jgi:hypothetical protein
MLANAFHAPGNKPMLCGTNRQAGARPTGRFVLARNLLAEPGNFAVGIGLLGHRIFSFCTFLLKSMTNSS